MRKVVRYIRVSTTEQAQHGHSLQAQDAVLEDYAGGHDLEVVGTFVESESAFTSGKRPEFARMVRLLEKRSDVSTILVYKYDRLARNAVDWSTLIETMGISVISVTEGETSDAENFLLGAMHNAFARHYSLQHSERVRLGMSTAAKGGKWPTYAPNGYINIKGEGIAPHPVYAPMVVRMFEQFAATDMSLSELTKWARAIGLRSRYGNPVPKSTIHRMLNNPLFYGMVRWKGTISLGKHEPLISKELWDAVQDRLHSRHRPREQKHRFPFRGLLTCGYCGCKITASTVKGGRYSYYHCTRRKGKCEQPFVRAEELGDRLVVATQGVHADVDLVSELLEDYRKEAVGRERERRARLVQAKSALSRAKGLRTKLYTDKLEGVIDDERWGEIDSSYASQEGDARREIERWSKVVDQEADQAARMFKLLDSLPERYLGDSDEERAKVLRILCSNLILRGENIDPVYRNPFDKIAEGVRSGNWWRWRDSNPRPKQSPVGVYKLRPVL